MAWVRFTDDYRWRATRASVIRYRAGMVGNVRAACADEAVAAGAAVRINNPKAVKHGDSDEGSEPPAP